MDSQNSNSACPSPEPVFFSLQCASPESREGVQAGKMKRLCRMTFSWLGIFILPQGQLFSVFLPSFFLSNISPIPLLPGFHIISLHDSGNTVALGRTPWTGMGKKMLTQDRFFLSLTHCEGLKEDEEQQQYTPQSGRPAFPSLD